MFVESIRCPVFILFAEACTDAGLDLSLTAGFITPNAIPELVAPSCNEFLGNINSIGSV